MTSWSTREIRILNEFGHLGVAEVQQIIYEVCGKKRSASSIQMRASREGISLCSYEICPECGRTVKRLKRNKFSDGLCELCYQRSFLTPNAQRADIMATIAKQDKEDEAAVKAAKARRLAERQQKSRDKKKLNETLNRR